jgi:hypothetical protein
MTGPRYSLRTMLLLMAATVPLGWFVAQFIRVDSQYVDPVTGAMKRTTTYWGLKTSEVIEQTELASWLEARGQGQSPQWQFIGSQSGGCFACGRSPPIHSLGKALPLLIEKLSEEELLAFVETLRAGDYLQQEAAVRALGMKYPEFR